MTDSPLRLPRAIVTGGAQGIGHAIAGEFLSAGYEVHLFDVARDALAGAHGKEPHYRTHAIDVSRAEEVEAAVESILQGGGEAIDVLINNAGVPGPNRAIEEVSPVEWRDTFAINVAGMFHCARAVIPVMKQRRGGSILNIATSSVITGLPNRTPYVTSKAAVLGFTRNLARELGPFDIRCNSILPGLVDNARGRALVERASVMSGTSQSDAEAEYLRYVSMRSWIQPSEIGALAVFLASDRARHISGQAIAVDGNMEWEG